MQKDPSQDPSAGMWKSLEDAQGLDRANSFTLRLYSPRTRSKSTLYMHWMKGKCKFSEKDCHYKHDKENTSSKETMDNKRKRSEDDGHTNEDVDFPVQWVLPGEWMVREVRDQEWSVPRDLPEGWMAKDGAVGPADHTFPEGWKISGIKGITTEVRCRNFEANSGRTVAGVEAGRTVLPEGWMSRVFWDNYEGWNRLFSLPHKWKKFKRLFSC